jgi:hypothetical protein
MLLVRRALAPLLFLVTLGMYLATLTQVHTFDALSYILSVERKPWRELFHPHHLAYGPLGALALTIGKALGYAGGAAVPMQVVNAVAGALGVACFFRVVEHTTQRIDLGLAMALLLACSYAYWYYAIEVEVYTVAALLLIACLAMLTNSATPSVARMLLLGLAQAGAVLFHQTNILLCIPIAIWWLLHWRAEPKRIGQLIVCGIAYASSLVLVVVAAYLWVGFGVSRFSGMDAFLAWMTEYARTGWWGGPITLEKWRKLGEGLSETFALGWGGHVVVALVVVGAIGYQLLAISYRLSAMLLTWLFSYGAFFFWWEPDNIEFWIASLPPALLLLALALRKLRPWGVASFALIALTIGLGITNFNAIEQRGDANTDLQRTIARTLAANSTPADLLIVPDGLQELYLPYYQQHEYFLSLNQAIFDAGGDWNAACTLIYSRIETARYAGATTLIAADALQPPAELLARHRLTQPQIESCFAPYQRELQAVKLPTQVPAYFRLPFAQEYADTVGWQFTQSALGWRSANVSNELFAHGWRMQPASDPSLTSPLVQIDTSQFVAIEIELANSTNARDAQLFFLGENGQANEVLSIRWQLSPRHEVQTYRLELQSTPGWQGIVTRLRIDPIGVGDGGEVRLVAVRLVGTP